MTASDTTPAEPTGTSAAEAAGREPLSDERLAEIRAREAAALTGPWVWDSGMISTYIDNDHEIIMWLDNIPGDPEDDAAAAGACGIRAEETAEANFKFLASAREDVPALLAEVDRLRDVERALLAEREQLLAKRDSLQDQLDRLRHSAKQCTATNTVRCGMPAGHSGDHLVERYNAFSRWTNQSWGAGWTSAGDGEPEAGSDV